MQKNLESINSIWNWIGENLNKWLQTISSVKTQVNEVLSNEKKSESDEIIKKILSWEYKFFSRWTKGRYIEDTLWYYIYTLVLDKNWEKKDVDIIFYPNINSKILIRIGYSFHEILISENPQILNIISKFYPLPVYAKDRYWWVFLSYVNQIN